MLRAIGVCQQSSSGYTWVEPVHAVREYPKMNCGRCGKEIDKKAANQKYCNKCSADLNRERSYGRKKEVQDGSV